MKHLARVEQVYQLLAADVPLAFPRLRSLAAFPNNLPLQRTSFVGRKQEVRRWLRGLYATTLMLLARLREQLPEPEIETLRALGRTMTEVEGLARDRARRGGPCGRRAA
ncbi:MAG: hypothetical protein ABR591_04140 [Candidatus Velthaea sp.]